MEKIKVKYLAKQIRGVSYKPEDLHDSLNDDSVILLRANNINEGRINFDDVVYVDKSKVSDEQFLKVGDVLICASSGSKQLVGKAASVDFVSPCTFGAFCKVVRPNNDVADYLGKYFQSGVYRRKISEVAIGANINNIRNEHIDSLELPIYKPEQAKKIVEKIGLIQRIIDNRKCELYKLDELIKARFVEMFESYMTKPGVQLAELAEITGGLTKNSKRNTFEKKMPYLRVANVFFNRLDLNEILEIGVREEEIEKTLLKQGDLLFVEGNGSIEQIGRVAVWDGSIKPILHQNHLIKARFTKEAISPQYALYYFMSQEGRQQIVSKSVSTSGLNTLSVNKIGALSIPVPPIELQNEFKEFVNQVNKSKIAVQKALDEAQTLFDSLMQEYFG